MDIAASRPWITAGIAVAGAGAIAISPITAPLPDLPDAQARPVQLTNFDPNNWTDVLQAAQANATDIFNHWSPAPSPLLHQVLANQAGYLQDLFNGSKSLTDVLDEMKTHLTDAGNAAITPFDPTNPAPFIYPSLDNTPVTVGVDTFLGNTSLPLGGHGEFLNVLLHGFPIELFGHDFGNIPILPVLIPDAALRTQVESVLDFSGSPLSGVLWGEIGTILGPLLQFQDDITAIGDALGGATPDWSTALQDLLNMPANITNAYLNGYGDVDLLSLLKEFGITVPSLGFSPEVDLGGLLSPGGSLFNAVGFDFATPGCSVICLTFDVPTTAVGPIASMIEMAQAMAEAIGWNGEPFTSLLSAV